MVKQLKTTGKRVLAYVWPHLSDQARRRLVWIGSAKVIVTAAGAVVNAQHELLILAHRFHLDARGVWDLPGGVVRPGEHPVVAVAREIREETGLEAIVGPLLLLESSADGRLHFCYLCSVSQTALTLASDEILNHRWIALAEPAPAFSEIQALARAALAHPHHFVPHSTMP